MASKKDWLLWAKDRQHEGDREHAVKELKRMHNDYSTSSRLKSYPDDARYIREILVEEYGDYSLAHITPTMSPLPNKDWDQQFAELLGNTAPIWIKE